MGHEIDSGSPKISNLIGLIRAKTGDLLAPKAEPGAALPAAPGLASDQQQADGSAHLYAYQPAGGKDEGSDPSKWSQLEMTRANLATMAGEIGRETAQAVNDGGEVDKGSKAQGSAQKPKEPKKHGFFGGLMKAFQKFLPIASMIMMFIPGLNVLALAIKVAQMAIKAKQMIEALKNGDLTGALGAIGSMASAIGGPAGMIGQLASAGSKGAAFAKNLAYGGISGALGSLGSLIPGEIGNTLNTASKAITAIQKGDYGALAGAVGSTGLVDKDAMTQLQGAVDVANGAIKHNAASALAGFGDLSGSADLSQFSPVAQALSSKDSGALVTALQGLGLSPEKHGEAMQALAKNTEVGSHLEAAFATGDTEAISQALGQAGVDPQQASELLAFQNA